MWHIHTHTNVHMSSLVPTIQKNKTLHKQDIRYIMDTYIIGTEYIVVGLNWARSMVSLSFSYKFPEFITLIDGILKMWSNKSNEARKNRNKLYCPFHGSLLFVLCMSTGCSQSNHQDVLDCCFTKYGPKTNIVAIMWVIIRDDVFQILLQNYWNIICILNYSQGDLHSH